jgi:proteasome lid subunit RPN8/RPN11
MSETPVEIPRHIVNELLHAAQDAPEREVCGLIGGRNGRPSSFYLVDNVAGLPACQFLLDAGGQVDAMRTMRERGESLFAIFHSHPNAPAFPSVKDLELADYTEALYLIVSLNTKGVLEMRGFRMDELSRLREVEMVLK